jgi:hypothetical protein
VDEQSVSRVLASCRHPLWDSSHCVARPQHGRSGSNPTIPSAASGSKASKPDVNVPTHWFGTQGVPGALRDHGPPRAARKTKRAARMPPFEPSAATVVGARRSNPRPRDRARRRTATQAAAAGSIHLSKSRGARASGRSSRRGCRRPAPVADRATAQFYDGAVRGEIVTDPGTDCMGQTSSRPQGEETLWRAPRLDPASDL